MAKPSLRLRTLFAQCEAVNFLAFMHPALLGGLAAAALPVALHFVGRRHAPVVHFAAFDFLHTANRRLAARERLRQWVLLALRTAALAVLALALSRPHPAAVGPPAAPVAARRVAFVLDVSASMAYAMGGETLLTRAVHQAQDALSHLAPGDTVTYVTAGGGDRGQLLAPSLDHSLVRAALAAQLAVKPAGVADLGGALTQAVAQLGRYLGAAKTDPREIYIFSDLARHSFAHLQAVGPAPLPPIHLVDAAGRATSQALGNVAIGAVRVQPGPSGAAAGERRVVVRVENYGATAVANRPLTLCVNDKTVVRVRVDVPSGATVDKVLTYTFNAPGLYRIESRLGPSIEDGYEADDVWRGYAEITPIVRVLAIDGEPRSTAYEDELYFLERALGAVPAGEPEIVVHSCPLPDLITALAAPHAADVVVLAHPGRLTQAQINALQQFVDGGGGLLLTLGRHTDFEVANAQLKALLPHPLRDLSRAADPGGASLALGLGSFAWHHPILHDLGPDAEASLRRSRTVQYFNLDVGAKTAAQTLLAFDNGAPALIEQRRPQAGRVLLWTTSIDVDLSDLPLRTAFVPLMQRSVRYLAHALAPSSRAALRAPAMAQVPRPNQSSAIALIGPSGQRFEAATSVDEAASLVSLGPLEEVGYYRAEVQQWGHWQPVATLALAVNARLDESNFLPITPQEVMATLRSVGRATQDTTVRAGLANLQNTTVDHAWTTWLLGAVLLLVAAESLLAARG